MTTLAEQIQRANLPPQIETAVVEDSYVSAFITLGDAWVCIDIEMPPGFPLAPPLAQVTAASSDEFTARARRSIDAHLNPETWCPAVSVPVVLLSVLSDLRPTASSPRMSWEV